MVGNIYKYVEERGFGWIKGEDGDRYFFHISNTNEPDEIYCGADVEFKYDYDQIKKRWSAYDVDIFEEENEEEDDEDNCEDEEYDYDEEDDDIGVENLSSRYNSSSQRQLGNLYLHYHYGELGTWVECQRCGSTNISIGYIEPDIAECPNCGEGYIKYV